VNVSAIAANVSDRSARSVVVSESVSAIAAGCVDSVSPMAAGCVDSVSAVSVDV
jgi:hypothetical protein